jgi:gluconokinase
LPPSVGNSEIVGKGAGRGRLSEQTLKGGSDEEILEWYFEHGRRSSDEEIGVWNSFLKSGWRDAGSEDLAAAKKDAGWETRDDIQTWVDLHDVDEGRKPGRTEIKKKCWAPRG